MNFAFGQSVNDRLEVDVLHSEQRIPLGEYHDDNWLVIKIRIRAGGFNGEVDASLLTVELMAFFTQLRLLCDTLVGTAELFTLEEQLKLRLTGDGRGHINLEGTVEDQPGIGNKLQFRLHFDQSQLVMSIKELENVVTQFPVREA